MTIQGYQVHLWRLPTGCAIPVTQTQFGSDGMHWEHTDWSSSPTAQMHCTHSSVSEKNRGYPQFSSIVLRCFKMMFHYKWIVSILVSILKQGYPQLSNEKRYPARFPSLRDSLTMDFLWALGALVLGQNLGILPQNSWWMDLGIL